MSYLVETNVLYLAEIVGNMMLEWQVPALPVELVSVQPKARNVQRDLQAHQVSRE